MSEMILIVSTKFNFHEEKYVYSVFSDKKYLQYIDGLQCNISEYLQSIETSWFTSLITIRCCNSKQKEEKIAILILEPNKLYPSYIINL